MWAKRSVKDPHEVLLRIQDSGRDYRPCAADRGRGRPGNAFLWKTGKSTANEQKRLVCALWFERKLEIAVIERAYDIFNGRILVPAEEKEMSGIERVWTFVTIG